MKTILEGGPRKANVAEKMRTALIEQKRGVKEWAQAIEQEITSVRAPSEDFTFDRPRASYKGSWPKVKKLIEAQGFLQRALYLVKEAQK